MSEQDSEEGALIDIIGQAIEWLATTVVLIADAFPESMGDFFDMPIGGDPGGVIDEVDGFGIPDNPVTQWPIFEPKDKLNFYDRENPLEEEDDDATDPDTD